MSSSSRDGARPARFDGNPFEHRLRALLADVAAGALSSEEALRRLRDLPFNDLGYAKVDHHRELRQGTCEIVYGPGKTVEEIRGIVTSLLEGNEGPILVTQANDEQRAAVRDLAATAGLGVEERPRSRVIAVARNVRRVGGTVLVVTAGTSDLPVAEEAALTASLMGAEVELTADVGVAGMHRLAGIRDRLEGADAIVVVAGMEGALASVVGGLVARPVVACPTSVGYGASFGGLAALLAMLSSCTPGVVCVNIDDGVGAGYSAALIARAGVTARAEPDRAPDVRAAATSRVR